LLFSPKAKVKRDANPNALQSLALFGLAIYRLDHLHGRFRECRMCGFKDKHIEDFACLNGELD